MGADWPIWLTATAIFNIALATSVTIHAVLWKRDSRAVIAWVGLAWLAPFVGALAYLVFGINRIERKAVSLKLQSAGSDGSQMTLSPEEKRIRQSEMRAYSNLVGLATAGQELSGRPLYPGNTVTALSDGDEAYPEMLDAIAKARRSVALLSYIFDSDRAGEAFLNALVEAKSRGIEVRVLVDDVGSKYSRPNMVRRLRKAGVNAVSFLPTRLPRLPKYTNLRNHRKILVIDGKTGFTGGTNIREDHWISLQPRFPVGCVHFRIEGPVVATLQQVFADDWAFAAGEKLEGEQWFPELERRGEVWARGIEDGPDENYQKMADLIAAALASARQHVRIVTPYFLPAQSLTQALNVTAMRGVDVEIFLPSKSNIRLVQWATAAQLWQVLEKGCRIYSTPPPFDHSKLMVVDGVWALIGSANWDPRSLRLNFEFNVECYDTELARSLNLIIDDKAASAREISLEEVNARSFPIRLRDGLARLLSPYL